MNNQNGKLVNQTELCKIFGITANTFLAWVDQGAPCVERGNKSRRWLINTAAFHRWMTDREIQMQNQPTNTQLMRLRKLRIEVQKAELELVRESLKYFPVKHIKAKLPELLTKIRNEFAQLPDIVADKVYGITDEQAVKRIMLAEIDFVLQHLGTTETLSDLH